MNKVKEILKYLELTSWAIAFFVVTMVCIQILYNLFLIGGKVNSEQALVRILISLLIILLPLVLKGARYAFKNV